MSGEAYSQVEQFHRDRVGIKASRLVAGPDAYADELARYIRCPSTVRARTFDYYGRGPSLEAIREMRQRHESADARYHAAWERLGHKDSDAWTRPAKAVVEATPVFVEPLPEPDPSLVLPDEIIAAVERAYRLSPGTITGKSRVAIAVRARNTAAQVFRLRGNSTPKIGALLGGRDHSSIVHALRQFGIRASDAERRFVARVSGVSA